MTEEEKLKALIMMMRSKDLNPADAPMTMESQVESMTNAPMSAGTIGPYIDAAQEKAKFQDQSADFSGRERAIDSQRKMAQKMRGQGPAQGREVGPLGVYMAPNWAEALSGAVTPAIGGYMEGQANRKDEDLDAERTMQKVALYKAKEAEQARTEAIEAERFGITSDQNQQKIIIAENAAKAAAARNLLVDEQRMQKAEFNILDDAGKEVRRTANSTIKHGRGVLKDANKRQQKILDAEMKALNESKDDEKALTAAQATALSRADQYREGLSSMEALLADGYDPTGVGGFVDKAANMSDITRAIASPEGQQFQAASDRVKEAALRTATGAAAPSGENAAYIRTLIPQPGDHISTVQDKMRRLDEYQLTLDKMHGQNPDMTDEEAEKRWNDLVDNMKKEDAKVEDIVIEQGDYRGMTKSKDGKIYNEAGEAVARWK